MAFCRNCGQNIPDQATFCSHCGTPVNNTAAPQQNAQQYTTGNSVAGGFNPADVQENKVMGVLSYISLLVLIPIFAAKDSEYARYHAKQGTKLCILSISYSIITLILNIILNAIFPPKYVLFAVVPNPIASVISMILGLAGIFFLVLAIIGIVTACKGERKPLPVIDKLTFIDDLISKFIK